MLSLPRENKLAENPRRLPSKDIAAMSMIATRFICVSSRAV